MTIAWDKVPPSSDDGGGQEIRRIILGSAGVEGGRALTPITNGHRKLVETINSIATAKTRDFPDLHWDCIQLVKAKQSDINCSIRYGEKYFALAAHGVQYAGKCSAANKQLDVADQGLVVLSQVSLMALLESGGRNSIRGVSLLSFPCLTGMATRMLPIGKTLAGSVLRFWIRSPRRRRPQGRSRRGRDVTGGRRSQDRSSLMTLASRRRSQDRSLLPSCPAVGRRSQDRSLTPRRRGP